MDKFTHMVISNDVYPNGVGVAYMIGTKAECATYVLKNGIRATTSIVPF